MKLDRRSFISLGVGGAVGSLLTPLPWKLTDDLAIWTQNWSWTPVPADGAISFQNSVCTLCNGGCGITVKKIDNRPVKIEGMKGHPVNDGGICILGLAGLQLLYGLSRFKSPMKRSGNRGENKWTEISWEDAIAEVASKLTTLREEGNSNKVAFIANSDKGSVSELIKRFLLSYGSPNFIKIPNAFDSYELATRLMLGTDGMPAFDFENSDFVLSFGSGILDGWGSPVNMFKTNSNWKDKGIKFIQIEPRLSNTASKSNKWIPINPGTEVFLALGIANKLIKDDKYNKKFVEKNCTGFEDFKKVILEEYDTSRVCDITGIKEKALNLLADSLSSAASPIAICGRGKGNKACDVNLVCAVNALNLLIGNINKKGGISYISDSKYIKFPELTLDDTSKQGLQSSIFDKAEKFKYPNEKNLLDRMPSLINNEDESPIKLLFVADSNPLFTMSDTNMVKSAFNKIPYIVSFSSYMDETSAFADIILPNHCYLERYQDVYVNSGLNKQIVSLCKPVIEPQYNTKNIGDVLIALASEIEGSVKEAFPWDDYLTCLNESLGEKMEMLQKDGFACLTAAPSVIKAFGTSSKKIEFTNQFVNFSGANFIQPEGDEKKYALTLIPYDTMRLVNGYIASSPFITKTVEDTVLKKNDIFIEINPVTAKSLGLANGQYALLETTKGKVKVRVNLFEGIMPGVIAMPTGFGHTAYDKYLCGKGVNVNELLGCVEDPVSGLDAAWGIRARLIKA
ncbi:MAG: molybdopterin-dependent oxidoreductase [Desulfobacterales bacterium]|nr:molybdopterin-dependent oxidoreductase [Desulfobacterales bacterium]